MTDINDEQRRRNLACLTGKTTRGANAPSESEELLLAHYRRLDDSERKAVRAIIERLAGRGESGTDDAA